MAGIEFTPEQQQMVQALVAKQVASLRPAPAETTQSVATDAPTAAPTESADPSQSPEQTLIPAIPVLQAPQKIGQPAQPQAPIPLRPTEMPKTPNPFNPTTVADIEKMHYQMSPKLTEAQMKVVHALKKPPPAIKAVLGVPATAPITTPII